MRALQVKGRDAAVRAWSLRVRPPWQPGVYAGVKKSRRNRGDR